MNSTSLLIGMTGGLLVVALVLSISGMNKKAGQFSNETEELKRELAELTRTRAELENARKPYLSPYSYLPPSPAESSGTVDTDTEKLQRQINELNAQNRDLANRVEQATRVPETQPEPEPVVEPLKEPEIALSEKDSIEVKSSSRSKLIEQALLQATVSAVSAEDGFVVLDPTPAANFSVGTRLGIRRNNGILCQVHIDSAQKGQYIGTIISSFGAQAAVQVGDEAIIPPVFDGELD